MLKPETIEQLSKVLGVSTDDFKTKLTSEAEEELEVPKLFRQDDLDTISRNMRKEGETVGKKIATEILVKDLKVKHGIESDTKDIDQFLDLFAKKHKSGDNIEAFREKYRTDLAAKDQEIEQIKGSIFGMQVANKIMQSVSALKKDTIIPMADIVTLYRSQRSFADDGGAIVIMKDGKPLKTDLQENVGLETDLQSFIEPYIKKEGMGGGDDPGDGGAVRKFKSPEDFYQWAMKKGIDPMSSEALAMYNKNKQ